MNKIEVSQLKTNSKKVAFKSRREQC